MTRPRFLHGAGAALLVAVFGSAMFTGLGLLLPGDTTARLLIAILGGAYVVYLLRSSGHPIGRIATPVLWTAMALALWPAGFSLPLYLAFHIGALWLIRSLYFYSGVLPAVADLGLTALGVAAATWAALQTGSVFLTLWSFFLVQALFVAIPERVGGPGNPETTAKPDRFQQAHTAAQAALQKLF